MNIRQQDLFLTVKSTLFSSFMHLIAWRFNLRLLFTHLYGNMLTLLILYSWSFHLLILQVNISIVMNFLVDFFHKHIWMIHLLYFSWTFLELTVQSRMVGQYNIMWVTSISKLRAFWYLWPYYEAFLFATKSVFIH